MANKLFHTKLLAAGNFLPYSAIVFLIVVLSACSTTHNYKLLSFFFDGVPSPANETVQKTADTLGGVTDTTLLALNTGKKAPQTMFMHSPYQDKQCASCHDQSKMGKLNKSQPDLCYECHENFNTKFKVLHGPVGGGQCTMCHNPHMSANEHLMTRTDRNVCLLCHVPEQIMKIKVHLDSKDASCTDCHNPHGGENRYALR